MAPLTYRDDEILAWNLLSQAFFCSTPAELFFRPDRSSAAPTCREAVKDGCHFRQPPEGLVLDGREHDGTLAVSERKTATGGSSVRFVTTVILVAFQFPFPTLCGAPHKVGYVAQTNMWRRA